MVYDPKDGWADSATTLDIEPLAGRIDARFDTFECRLTDYVDQRLRTHQRFLLWSNLIVAATVIEVAFVR